MPQGELYINNKDAFTEWGVSMEDGLSALMTPPPLKPTVQNKSRLEHGTRVINLNPKWDEREVTLTIHLLASSEAQFFTRYNSFISELSGGEINIKTKYQPNVTYKMYFLNCTQFSQLMRGIAKFSLRLYEPNPNDR